jgi:predicted permease
MSAQAGLIPSFVAAIQASLSVLLVISYGGIAAYFKFLNPATSKSISKICVQMFLPALLLVQIGSELHADSAKRYVVIFVWALICHFVSFLIGIAAHLWLDMPDWITAALMFNNTTSYPLLLIQSLDGTGILSSLIVTDESTRAAIERAKSYFLVFATVSSCLTFAVGPRLIAWEHAPDTPTDSESDKEDSDVEDEETGPVNGNGNGRRFSSEEPCSPTDRTQLLVPDFPRSSVSASDRRLSTVKFFPSRRPSNFSNAIIYNNRRPSVIPRKKWLEYHETTRWWLLFLWDFLNAPLLGAAAGVVIGLIPRLHTAFFSPSNEGGIFTAWLTASLKNIGSLFVPLPVVVAGVSLYFSTQRASSSTESKVCLYSVSIFDICQRSSALEIYS